MKYKNIQNQHAKVYKIIAKEEKRKKETLEMIPSENHTSPAVLEALSSVLNDKYAEGYPGKRYYGGNEHIDEIEVLCQERAKKLFGVPFANVQSYSGSPANMAVYFAVLRPGEKIMGMDLSAGGHLTHGQKVSFSGTYYDSVFYGVDKETMLIDYDMVESIAKKEKPKLIFAGTTSYPRIVDFKRFRDIADSVGAYLCADISHTAGLIASGAHPDPVDYVHIITTTTHKTLRGPRGAMIMVTDRGMEKDKDLPKKINKAVFPGLQGGPHEHQIAGIAVCLKEAMDLSFAEYGKQVIKNCQKLAEELIKREFELISGGTDSHLLLVDLRNKNVLGEEAQNLLERAGVIVNKNSIPFDPNPPFRPSGIRLGTPAITTRGMREEEMVKIAAFISVVIREKDEKTIEKTRKEIKNMCKKFILPQ